MKKNDIILIAILLLVAAAGFLLFSALRTDGDIAVVLIDGEEVARYPLDKDFQKDIITEYGKNVLTIKDGKAFVKEADCPDGICVSHRAVWRVGDTIVCLPHKLVIRIDSGRAEKTVDAVI